DQSVEPAVMDTLQQQGVGDFTLWGDCHGAGTTGIRQGNPIWPGLNTVVMVVMEETQVEPLRQELHALRDTFAITPGLKMIITDAVMI
ncbi:MAG: PG0541 family transporter-associated protein, partial [Armatimonadia bacterium]